jgi:acetylglutamate kinase
MRVVKLGGSSLDGALPDLGAALASHPDAQVIVHGGGPQTDELAERLGIPTRKAGGRRITDPLTLEAVVMSVAGLLHNRLVAGLIAGGLDAVGVAGPTVLRARRRPPIEVEGRLIDFGQVGEIEAVSAMPLQAIFRAGAVPVIPCIAGGDDGSLLNVNADTVAARVAVSLKAAELVQVTDTGGVRAEAGNATTLIPRLTTSEARALLADGRASGGMRPKLEAALAALEAGVPVVRIAGIRDLAGPGGGTLLTAA